MKPSRPVHLPGLGQRTPKVLRVAELQARIDRIVAMFQSDCEPFTHPGGRHENQSIYRLLRDAQRPMGRKEISAALGWPDDTDGQHRTHGRLDYMVKEGWLVDAGRGRSSYYTKSDRTHRLFATALNPTIKRVVAAKRWLDSEIDWLDQRAYQVPSCMTNHVARPLDGRTQAMFERRLNGEDLQAIGDDCGLTRERVRQIINKAYQPVYIPKQPKPPIARIIKTRKKRPRASRDKRWKAPDDPTGWWLI